MPNLLGVRSSAKSPLPIASSDEAAGNSALSAPAGAKAHVQEGLPPARVRTRSKIEATEDSNVADPQTPSDAPSRARGAGLMASVAGGKAMRFGLPRLWRARSDNDLFGRNKTSWREHTPPPMPVTQRVNDSDRAADNALRLSDTCASNEARATPSTPTTARPTLASPHAPRLPIHATFQRGATLPFPGPPTAGGASSASTRSLRQQPSGEWVAGARPSSDSARSAPGLSAAFSTMPPSLDVAAAPSTSTLPSPVRLVGAAMGASPLASHGRRPSTASGPVSGAACGQAGGPAGSHSHRASTASSQVGGPAHHAASRPSTASSAYAPSWYADGAWTAATSPSLRTADSFSSRPSEAQGYFELPKKRTAREQNAIGMLRSWQQDDLLRDLALGVPSPLTARRRRLRDVLLGALTADVLQFIGRVYGLSDEASATLRRKQQHLWRTRDEDFVSEAVLRCNQALLQHTNRLRDVAASRRSTSERRARQEASHLERAERSLARFVADAVDLPDVLDQDGFRLAPNLRSHVRHHSDALSGKDAFALLSPLNLDARQQARLKEYLARNEQLCHTLTPQVSLDSTATSEPTHPASP